MKKEVKKFLEFNGKRIFFIAADGEYWIALKPICESIGVSWEKQHEKLQNGNDIFGELSTDRGIVAADGRIRKMTCLQERFIYGWIYSIQFTSQMSDETRQNLKKYKMECCDVLYDHFKGIITERESKLKYKTLDEFEIERLEMELLDSPQYQKIKELKQRVQQANRKLRELDKELVDSQLDLWKTDPSATGKED